MIRTVLLTAATFALAQPALAQDATRAKLDAMIAAHAQANGIPVALVHRVVKRESGYRPHLVGRGGAIGLMQIKLATARGLGYTGTARGLLDPETNLTYAVRYLAGAYRVADGNPGRAVSNYARGYYYAAKRRGMHALAAALNSGTAAADFAQAPVPTAVVASESAAPEPAAVIDRDAYMHLDEPVQ
jgi:soluble lytic murein transglycosylase-like protein